MRIESIILRNYRLFRELEAWYLGEPDALADAFGHEALRTIGRNARFRDPDSVLRPSEAVERFVPEFQKVQKVSGARRMAQHLSRERNTFPSFRTFVAGIETVAAELAASETRANG